MNAVHPQARPFIQALARKQLLHQRCNACSRVQSLARALCHHCHSDRLAWEHSAGTGIVEAVSRIDRAPSPQFRELVPYTLVIVAMAEGHRLMGHAQPGLAIGEPVTAGFFEHDSRTLIRFTRS